MVADIRVPARPRLPFAGRLGGGASLDGTEGRRVGRSGGRPLDDAARRQAAGRAGGSAADRRRGVRGRCPRSRVVGGVRRAALAAGDGLRRDRRRRRSDLPGTVPPPAGRGAALLVEALTLSSADIFVDLGCGDAALLVDVARRSGCSAVGVEVSAALALAGTRRVRAEGLDGRVRVEHGLADARSLAGVTVAYAWLLHARSRRRSGPACGTRSLRAIAVAGGVGGLDRFGPFERIGSVPVPDGSGPASGTHGVSLPGPGRDDPERPRPRRRARGRPVWIRHSAAGGPSSSETVSGVTGTPDGVPARDPPAEARKKPDALIKQASARRGGPARRKPPEYNGLRGALSSGNPSNSGFLWDGLWDGISARRSETGGPPTH